MNRIQVPTSNASVPGTREDSHINFFMLDINLTSGMQPLSPSSKRPSKFFESFHSWAKWKVFKMHGPTVSFKIYKTDENVTDRLAMYQCFMIAEIRKSNRLNTANELLRSNISKRPRLKLPL